MLVNIAVFMVMRHNYGRSLELQLKPNHVPFKLAAFWEELLEKYTVTSPEDMERGQCVSALVHFMILCTPFYGHYVFSVVLVSVGSIIRCVICFCFLDEPVLIFKKNVFFARNEEALVCAAD